MAPEEGKPMKVDVALDGEALQLTEEALAEVQRLLAPEHLVMNVINRPSTVR